MEKTKKEVYASRIKLFRVLGFIGIGISTILVVCFIVFDKKNTLMFGVFNSSVIMYSMFSFFAGTYVLGRIVGKYNILERKEEEQEEKIVVKTILEMLKNKNYPDAIKTYNEKIKFSKTKKFLTPFFLSELLNSGNSVYIGFAEKVISFSEYEVFFLKDINI
jgi:hypothetical protein